MGNEQKKYYSEELEKDTRYRKEYETGIEAFLQKQKELVKANRDAFISPEKYKNAPEEYREKFLQMLGFPLTQERELPTLSEKTFVASDKNVNIYRMQLTFFGFLKFYGMYFEQKEQTDQTPFILGIHGGAGTPELISSIHMDSGNYNHLVRRMTDRGANVFAPQLLLWLKDWYGGEYDRAHVDGKLRQLDGSITALELYLMSGCIDYFLANEKANAELDFLFANL